MSRSRLECAWWVSGGFLEGVCKVFGMCLEAIRKVSVRCQEAPWKVPGKSPDSI